MPRIYFRTAQQSLKTNANGKVSCCISINYKNEQLLEKVLNQGDSNVHKYILAECYFVSLFVQQILKKINVAKHTNQMTINQIAEGIKILEGGNLKNAINYYVKAPHITEINGLIKKHDCKLELNILLNGCKNIYLQQAINKFVASRNPFVIKIFSNKELATHYTYDGQLIQCPHDYLTPMSRIMADIRQPEK